RRGPQVCQASERGQFMSRPACRLSDAYLEMLSGPLNLRAKPFNVVPSSPRFCLEFTVFDSIESTVTVKKRSSSPAAFCNRSHSTRLPISADIFRTNMKGQSHVFQEFSSISICS